MFDGYCLSLKCPVLLDQYRTRWLVFIEVTGGPFRKSDSNFAPWSPEDNDLVEIGRFFEKIEAL